MADEQAWKDRQRLVELFIRLQRHLDIFKGVFEEIKKFKVDVLDDAQRKAEMKKLIDEDPDLTMTKIQIKYSEFKTIYDYLNN